MPDRAELHEQKAQVLLEIGEAWNALKAATRMSCFHLPFHVFLQSSYLKKLHNSSDYQPILHGHATFLLFHYSRFSSSMLFSFLLLF